MEITEVKVFPVGEEKLKAFVSIVFDHCFMVNDIKIIQGRQGLFISMPSRKKKNGEFKDVAHPLNNDTRRMIEGQVLSEYDRVLEERSGTSEVRPRPEPQPRARPEPPARQEEVTKEQQAAKQEEARGEEETEGKSLEEVEEIHLRDSFWTVP